MKTLSTAATVVCVKNPLTIRTPVFVMTATACFIGASAALGTEHITDVTLAAQLSTSQQNSVATNSRTRMADTKMWAA